MIRKTPSHPPQHLTALDDFLWRTFESRDAWTAWAHERYDVSLAAARREYAGAMRLQAALRRLQIGNSSDEADPAAAAEIDALIVDRRVRPTVRGDGTMRFSAGRGATAALIVDAVGAMTDGSWKRFKRCRNAACTASFYDTTKNGTRSWCSMSKCGARDKMRRFRSKSDTAELV